MSRSTTVGQQYEDEISLFDLWRILRDDWIILVGSTLAGVVLAVTASLVMTPVYRASIVIVELDNNEGAGMSMLGQLGGLASLAGIDLAGGSQTGASGRTIIESRTFIEHFIEQQNLLPVLYADIWNKAKGTWSAEVQSPPADWQAANHFKRDIFVLEEDPETGLLTLSIEWTDPALAAFWANELVQMVNEIARRRDIADAEARIEYLNEQIEETNILELERVLYSLIENEQKTLMLANARKDYAFEVVDPAVVPVNPSRPNRLILLIMGTLGGGFLGLMVVFVTRVSRRLREQEAALTRSNQ